MNDDSSLNDIESQGASSAVSSIGTDDRSSMMADDMVDEDNQEAQLNLHNIALTGRRMEYGLLKASYKRIEKGQHPSEVILISGLSGTGKRKLAESIREPVTLQRHGFFVAGKFDQLSNEPYSALVEAFSDLCDLVSQDTQTCKAIAKALKGDISILGKVIPNLSTVTGSFPGDSITSSTTTSHHAQANSFSQLKLAFRKFLGAIANRRHPVVLLVDDLQWADSASLGVIQSIITDVNSKYVLLIGTYRSNEANALKDLLETVNNKEGCLNCTSIQLENFGCDQVASLIAKCTTYMYCYSKYSRR